MNHFLLISFPFRYIREDLQSRGESKSTNESSSAGVLEATLMVLPVCHNYGYCMMINTLLAGGRVVMLPKFSIHNFLSAIQTHKVQYLHYTFTPGCKISPPLLAL